MDIRSVGDLTRSSPARAAAAETPAAAAVAAPAPAQPAAVKPAAGQLDQAVSELNKAMKNTATNIEFSVDEETHQRVVKVIDQNTKEVLRQLPTEEALEIARSIDKLQGLLIKNEA